MQIEAKNLGKRFNLDWIFRNLNLHFYSDKSYAITGSNGSGKSTLLQILSGILPFSEGSLNYSKGQTLIEPDSIYQHLSLAAPYQELIEEFTLSEQIQFHLKFKKLKENLTKEELIHILQLEKSQNKEIRFFSSGMKQRLKLGLAMYSNTSMLLLDEPTTNLDAQGIDWYQYEIKKNLSNRLVIICSNQLHEYDFCDEVIAMAK